MPASCTIDGCNLPHHATGLCQAHYSRRRRGTDLTTPIRHRPPLHPHCTLPDCTDKHYALGLCRRHYVAEWAGRDMLSVRPRPATPPAT